MIIYYSEFGTITPIVKNLDKRNENRKKERVKNGFRKIWRTNIDIEKKIGEKKRNEWDIRMFGNNSYMLSSRILASWGIVEEWVLFWEYG